jgi:hypothetical protein
MDPIQERCLCMTRRHFFGLNAAGIGTAVLASLFDRDLLADEAARITAASDRPFPGLPGFPNFAPKAKRVIYMIQ